MKKFNQLSSVEKYVRLKKNTVLCKVGKWTSILSPYIIIGIANFDEYFTEANGVKMSLGCTLALVVGGIAIMNETKESKKINGLVAWAVAFALAFFLQSILNDLVMILGFGLIGQLIGAGFELGAEKENEKAELYKKANIEAEAKKEM